MSGLVIALGSNAINNLPAGLIASATALQAHSPERVIDALLIGVDLGPNLSITGSLATILWLSSIRREGEEVASCSSSRSARSSCCPRSCWRSARGS